MTRLKEVKKPSCIPIYGFGISFLLYCVLFPMYSALHLAICTFTAALVFLILRKLFPPKVILVPQKERKPDTGNPALDEAVMQGRELLRLLRKRNDEIPDQAFSEELDEIERLTEAMLAQVTAAPDKLPKIRTMLNYFLPTTVSLISRYAELEPQRGIENVDHIRSEIRQSVHSVRLALGRQLNSLYDYDAIDVTAEIRVMEQMLQNHGLADETIQKKE